MPYLCIQYADARTVAQAVLPLLLHRVLYATVSRLAGHTSNPQELHVINVCPAIATAAVGRRRIFTSFHRKGQ
jgi:hypothetical protein